MDRELLRRVAEEVRDAYLWHAPPDILSDMRGVSLDAIIDRVLADAPEGVSLNVHEEDGDAALVAELRRLASEQGEQGTCDCDGAGDCDACWTRKGVRMLDLAEEALRLRAENEKLREEREEDQGVIRVWRGRTARAEAEVLLESLPEPAEHVTCAFCEGAAPRCFVICDGCIEKGRVAMQPTEHEQAAQDAVATKDLFLGEDATAAHARAVKELSAAGLDADGVGREMRAFAWNTAIAAARAKGLAEGARVERERWMQAVVALVGYETASAVRDEVARAQEVTSIDEQVRDAIGETQDELIAPSTVDASTTKV